MCTHKTFCMCTFTMLLFTDQLHCSRLLSRVLSCTLHSKFYTWLVNLAWHNTEVHKYLLNSIVQSKTSTPLRVHNGKTLLCKEHCNDDGMSQWLVAQEHPAKRVFDHIYRMCWERELVCLDQFDFIGFPRGIIFFIGFALSADCQ